MTTAEAKKIKRPIPRAIYQYLVLVAIYVVLIFLLPINSDTSATYHLTPLAYRGVMLALAVPTLLVWLAAFLGYTKLHQYAVAIQDTHEGQYFEKLATGCAWLAWSLPIGTIIPALLNGIANHQHGFHPSAIVITNYISLVLPLIAFSIIAVASRGLLAHVKVRLSIANARLILFGFLAIGVLYCFFTFRHFELSSLSSSSNPYFLPLWLMVLTVTIPYLYTWFIGLLATNEIILYRKHVQGVLYRQALRFMVLGLLAVVVSSIILQYINGVSPRVGHLVFGEKLVLTTLFRIVGGGGFILLAIGASKLKRIEEV